MKNLFARINWGALGLVAVVAAFCFAGYIDFTEELRKPPVTVYTFPPMATPCREPIPNKEMRIWIDKRYSETEGERTCRVIPIKSGGMNSHYEVWSGVRG